VTKRNILKNDWNFGTNFGAKVPIVLPNIFLCVQQKKETHSGLQQLEGGCVNDDRI